METAGFKAGVESGATKFRSGSQILSGEFVIKAVCEDSFNNKKFYFWSVAKADQPDEVVGKLFPPYKRKLDADGNEIPVGNLRAELLSLAQNKTDFEVMTSFVGRHVRLSVGRHTVFGFDGRKHMVEHQVIDLI